MTGSSVWSISCAWEFPCRNAGVGAENGHTSSLAGTELRFPDARRRFEQITKSGRRRFSKECTCDSANKVLTRGCRLVLSAVCRLSLWFLAFRKLRKEGGWWDLEIIMWVLCSCLRWLCPHCDEMHKKKLVRLKKMAVLYGAVSACCNYKNSYVQVKLGVYSAQSS